MFENGSSENNVVVHFNLHEAEKGIQGDKSQLMYRFLDACTSCQKVTGSGGRPAGCKIARRVFTRDGNEITDVHDLVYDQEIWLSYGEDFKSPHGKLLLNSYFVIFVSITVSKVPVIFFSKLLCHHGHGSPKYILLFSC